MSDVATLVVTATVMAAGGDVAQIDRGVLDGLAPTDQGVVYYEIRAGDQPRRIEVGSCEVEVVGETDATIRATITTAEGDVQPGYRVEFRVPGDRLSAPRVLELARARLSPHVTQEIVAAYVDAMVPNDARIERMVMRELRDRGDAQMPEEPRDEALRVDLEGGSYWIGLELSDADYYDQHPRFAIFIQPFSIHATTVPDSGGGGGMPRARVSWDEAAAYCRAHGMRLPSEFEWEVAAELIAGPDGGRVFEWTSSWYEAYPGNPEPSDKYGRKYRVVRGGPGALSEIRHRRRFLEPGARRDDVGFRCVREGAP